MNRVFKYALMFAFVGIAMFALSQMSDNADAATVKWDGGSTTSDLASNATNWDGDALPNVGDDIIFDGSVTNTNCIWDLTRDHVGAFISWNSYNGTITINEPLIMWGYFQFDAATIVLNNEITGGFLEVNYKLYLYSDWNGNLYYNGTNDITTNQQHWSGWLYCDKDIRIQYNNYAYLEFNHDAWLGVQLESWSGTDNFTWNATSVASQTVVWSWSRGESSAMYDEYMDTIYIGSDETNAGGMGTFTSTFVGSHAFLLSRSSFLPASTDIDDSVWLGILFMCIATIINFVGYVRKIGLLQIVSFLVLLVGIFAATDVWEELWTLPTLFVLSNAVLFVIGMIRKG